MMRDRNDEKEYKNLSYMNIRVEMNTNNIIKVDFEEFIGRCQQSHNDI